MKINKKNCVKFVLTSFGLFSIFGILANTVTSCSNVDSNLIRTLDVQSINAKTNFSQLNKVNEANVKNLVLGSKNFNNGNYVLAIGTYSNLSQWQFFNGINSQGPADQKRWNGEFGNAVSIFSGNNSPVKDSYPLGIKFGLFIDEATNIPAGQDDTNNKNNPFAKYPNVDTDNPIASQTSKDRSGKYRREDESAVQYRDIVNLVYDTYSTNSIVASWFTKTAELPTSSSVTFDPSQDVYSEITKYMVIAFKQNQDGVIERAFYSIGGTSENNPSDPGTGDSTTPDDGNNGTNTNNPDTPENGADATLPNGSTNDSSSSTSSNSNFSNSNASKLITKVGVAGSSLVDFLTSFYRK
ncbi:DUF6856 family protein [Mycoplasmoides alvi]|uniref:DUF6856 family protein n=1 Tax=Mycoplasmoides alvi TaxID=78580 RepID=UPI00051C6AB0|nr:hypothetical protein [Mycoplasmoides alvi]